MKVFIQHLYISGKFSTCVFLSFVMIIAFSCKKEPSDIPCPECCVPLNPCTQPTLGGGYYYISEPNYCNYTMPYFNPQNDNEFLFVKHCSTDSSYAKILKYNILSDISTEIFSGSVQYAPKWGQNGWIIFSQSDGNVYKIKSDGSDLTQLTTEGCFHYPDWYFDEDKFVAYNICLDADILYDVEGVVLDTLPKLIGTSSTIHQFPYIVSNLYNELSFYNMNTHSFEYQYNYDQPNSSHWGSIFWLSESTVIYSNIKGLNKLTIPSLTNVNFKPSCNSKIYLFGSVNSSKTKMIWNRGDYTQINECTLKYKSRIYIMNIDGTNEEEIEIN